MITGWLLYTCNECSNSNGSQDAFFTIFNCTCSLSIIYSVIEVQYLLVRLFLLLPQPAAAAATPSSSSHFCFGFPTSHALVEHNLTVEVLSLSLQGEVVNCFCCQTWSQQDLVKLIVYHQSLQSFVCHLVSAMVTTCPHQI